MPNRKSKRNNPNKKTKQTRKLPDNLYDGLTEEHRKKLDNCVHFFYKGTAVSLVEGNGEEVLGLCRAKNWNDWKEGAPNEAYIQQLRMMEEMIHSGNGEFMDDKMSMLYCINIYYCVYVAKCLPNNNDNGIVIVSDNGGVGSINYM